MNKMKIIAAFAAVAFAGAAMAQPGGHETGGIAHHHHHRHGWRMPPPPPPPQDKPTDEDLYNRALEVVRTTKRASISHLQRKMGIGYNHAAHLIDLLEDRGIIGPGVGVQPREILMP